MAMIESRTGKVVFLTSPCPLLSLRRNESREIRSAPIRTQVILGIFFAHRAHMRFIGRVIGNLLQPEIKDLIAKRDFNQLREILCDFPAADLSEIFFDLSPDDEAVLMRILPRQLAAEVFEYLPVDDQEKMLHALGTEQVSQILNDLSPDDRTALLQELPAAATQKLLDLLNPEERRVATQLLGYPEKSIGRR